MLGSEQTEPATTNPVTPAAIISSEESDLKLRRPFYNKNTGHGILKNRVSILHAFPSESCLYRLANPFALPFFPSRYRFPSFFDGF